MLTLVRNVAVQLVSANQTGKKLSPRKIMMDTRDRLEAVGKNIDANNGNFNPDGKQLLGDYISTEKFGLVPAVMLV